MFDQYQKQAMLTKNTGLDNREQLIIAALGIAGEAGEFADHVKKWHGQGHEFDLEKAIGELGDVLWYVTLAADTLGLSLGYVAERNIRKLRARYEGGGFDPDLSRNREQVPDGIWGPV